jgi:hypothetical protein
MFVVLDVMEHAKVRGSNELDCVMVLGFFFGLVHPLAVYATLAGMYVYLV